MPWKALPQMAVAVAIRPYAADAKYPGDLPLELGDDLYLIEQGGRDGAWYRGYLVAPPSLLSGLSSSQGQNLEARVFSGVFPASCVRIREYLPNQSQEPSQLVTESPRRSRTVDEPEFLGRGLVSRKLSHRSLVRSSSKPLLNGDRPPAPVPMLKIGDESTASSSEPLIDEISSCMREWHSKNLHELLLARQYQTLEKLHSLIARLDVARKQLVLGLLTDHELRKVREESIWNMVNGNKLVGNEIVVRDPQSQGRLLPGDDSPVELAKLQSTMSLLDRPPHVSVDNSVEHNITVNIKDFHVPGVPDPVATMFLCKVEQDKSPDFFTELYSLHLESTPKRAAVFTDLTNRDIGLSGSAPCHLFLVLGLYSHQPLPHRPSAPPRVDSSASSVTSPTRPRQSLMWVNKFSRNKSPLPKSPIPDATSNVPKINEIPQSSDSKRPPTRDSMRPGTQSGATSIRRLLGWALLDISDILRSSHLDSSLPVWAQSPPSQTSAWNAIWNELSTGPGANGAYSLEINAHTGTPVGAIPRILRSDLGGVSIKPRSDIYVGIRGIILPAKALLSHPDHGTVPGPGVQDMQQLQLTLEVRKSSGERIENCIVPSAATEPLTAWRTCAVARGQAWADRIKLCISDDQVADAHLIMSIADAPNFPFALCWLPLWTDEAVIKDGLHAPLLYAYDKVTSGHTNGRGAYLNYAWNARTKREESVVGHLATLQISTKLCSTSASQDKTLLGLRNWRSLSKTQTLDLVKQTSLVPEVEITKLFTDVLDSLFGILIANAANEEFEDAVLTALVSTLNIVHDRRFDLARRIDDYVEHTFDQPYAASSLLQAFSRLLVEDRQKAARAAFKVGQHIFKFIFHARKQQQAKESEIGASMQSPFRHDLLSTFGGLEALIRNPAPSLVGNKTLLMQFLPQWLPEFKLLLSEMDILELVESFLAACNSVEGKLTMHKLVFLRKMALFFVEARCVARIQRLCSDAVCLYAGDRESIRLCTSILCVIHKQPGFDWNLHVRNALQSFVFLLDQPQPPHDHFSLLFPQIYPFPTRPATAGTCDEALLELGAFLAIFAYSEASLNVSMEDAVPVLETLLLVLQTLLSGTVFPKSWLSLHVHYHKMSLWMLELIFRELETKLLPAPEEAAKFETDLWHTFLETLLLIVRSDVVALETFPEQKRRAVWKIAGDIRDQGARLLQKTWWTLGWDGESHGLKRIGGYQVQYVPGLVGPIVDLCLSVHEGLRREAIDIFQAMVISEWDLNEDLSMIQAEMIDCLDQSKHDGVVHKMFIRDLLKAFNRVASDEPLWQAIQDMVATIDELLALLVAVQSRESDEPRRVLDTLQLMDFLKDMNKEDMFIRYVHQLARTQKGLGNHTQAGLALQLHAKQYAWDSLPVRELGEPQFPQQASWERKEHLYFEMIKHFEDGEAWLPALSCYKELCEQYETVQYEFGKLARAQRAMASIYESISRGQWPSPRYFKVKYRGLGFPESLREREYVYEGDAHERLSAFIDRIRLLHPLAQVLGKQEPTDLEGQYLDISPLGVHRNLGASIYQQPKLSSATREFLATKQPQEFSTTSKRHAGTAPVEEQWIEKTVYTTHDAFPTLSRRSEIVKVTTEQLSPIETALERTTRKTAELAALERQALAGDESVSGPLSEGLSSSIDAASPTSISQYRPLVSGEVEQSALRIAILDHVHTIKRCLMHLSQSSQLELQRSLSAGFEATYGPELALMQPEEPVEVRAPVIINRLSVVSEKRQSALPAPLMKSVVVEKPVRKNGETTVVNGVKTPLTVSRPKKRMSLLGLGRIGRRRPDPR